MEGRGGQARLGRWRGWQANHSLRRAQKGVPIQPATLDGCSKLLFNRGRWIEADDEGMCSSENRELKYDQITALNKKKWNSKGIAKVLYEVDGRKKKIVLDDCNYERDTTQAILRHVEAAIGHDKITNGKPEPPPKAPTATTSTTQ